MNDTVKVKETRPIAGEDEIVMLICIPGKRAGYAVLERDVVKAEIAEGYVELIPLDDYGNFIVCNKNARERGLPFCRTYIRVGSNGRLRSQRYIYGAFFVCNIADGDVRELTDDWCSYYCHHFFTPERLFTDESGREFTELCGEYEA